MPQTITVPVQVRFADLDVLGHVNNVAFYTLMETARVEWLRVTAPELRGGMVVARSECDYLHEIPGGTREVLVDVFPEKIGTTSFVVRHDLRVDGELVGVGRVVLVALGDDRRPRPLTEQERTWLS